MGRIKELQEKLAAGSLSDVEQKELDELLLEAKGETSDEEKAIDDLADKLATQASEKLEKGLAKLLDTIEKKSQPPVIMTKSSPAFFVNKELGKKTVAELSEIKIAIPGRENKQYKEVSAKSAIFVQALMQGDKEKLQLLTEGTAANGGYLVPDEFANMIIEDRRDNVVMRNIATVMTTQSDTFHLPNLATRPKAAFRSEAAVKNTSTVTFGENVFTPYSLAVIVGLSNELVADARLGVNGSILNYVAKLMATSLREREEKAFWTGDGSGQPTGISQYSPRSVAASITDASRSDSLIQGFIRTPQGYRNSGVWVMNSQTLEKVMTLKDSNGNYLISRLPDSPQMTIKGRPIYEQNDLAVGTAYFGDFGYYTIVDRQGITVDVSDVATVGGASAFEKNLTYVRVESRVDGELTLTDGLTKVSGLGTP